MPCYGQVNIVVNVPDTTRLNPAAPMVMEYPRPPIYDIWFKRIVQCEGLFMPPQEEIDKFHYFMVNQEKFNFPGALGYYDAITNSREHIMIIDLPSVWDYNVIGHEFLHFVLWYNFGPLYSSPGHDHPDKYFGHCGIRPN